MKQIKTHRVGWLRPNTKFYFPDSRNPDNRFPLFKDMKVIRSSECATLVEGFERDSIDDPWLAKRSYIANSCEVCIDDKPRVVQKSQRGRKASIDFQIPDGVWTIKQAAKHNDITPARAYNYIQKLLNTKVRVVSRGKKGRNGVPSQYQEITC